MKLLEYQGKELFKDYGIKVPNSYLAKNIEEAKKGAEKIGFPFVLKSQLTVGGRGKAGAILKCKNEKELSEFRKMAKSPDGHSVWCRRCFSEYEAERYQNGDKARKNANRAALIKRNKEALWNYLSTNPCVDCGITDPRVLEFDHKDESTKAYNVSEMFGLGWSTIMKEIEKCDVRCANCHRIRTQEQFGTWRSNRA